MFVFDFFGNPVPMKARSQLSVFVSFVLFGV